MTIEASIIVPCYNEAKNIPLILETFASILKDDSIEVLLVENGSSDNSREVMHQELAKYSFARMVPVDENQGYGFGILQGLSQAKGKYQGWLHADLQTHPSDFLKGLELIKKEGSEQCFAKGWRVGRPLKDQVFTWGMAIYVSLLFGRFFWEVNAQPNIFSTEFVRTWKNPPYNFNLDFYALLQAKRAGLKALRFKVEFPERVHGESSWAFNFSSKWRVIKQYLSYAWDVRFGKIA